MSGTSKPTIIIKGEFYQHTERPDGTRDLYYGPVGSSDHAHDVLDRSGNPRYVREVNGRVIADDKIRDE